MTERTTVFGRCSRCGEGFTVAWGVVILESPEGNICTECRKAENDAENARIGAELAVDLSVRRAAKAAQIKRRRVRQARG